ncbi:MAG: hypothetical protein V4642_00350 [Bacteroidota bacterium]
MKILLGFVLLCGMASSAFGQYSIESGDLRGTIRAPRLYIGLTSGYGITFLPGGIENPFLKDRDFRNVLAHTYSLGISTEYFLVSRMHTRYVSGSLIFKAIYRNYSSADNSFLQTEEKTVGSQSRTVETQYSTHYQSSLFNIDVLYSNPLSESAPFSVIAGPGFGLLINEYLSKQAEILHPSDFTFDENSFEGDDQLEQNGRAAVFKNDNASSFQAYIKAGVQYSIYFGSRDQFQLVPSASFNFGITKPYSTEKFRLSTIDFGVDFRTAL